MSANAIMCGSACRGLCICPWAGCRGVALSETACFSLPEAPCSRIAYSSHCHTSKALESTRGRGSVLWEHEAGRASGQSEIAMFVCACSLLGQDIGAPASGNTWAEGRHVSLSQGWMQALWATVFHGKEACKAHLA